MVKVGIARPVAPIGGGAFGEKFHGHVTKAARLGSLRKPLEVAGIDGVAPDHGVERVLVQIEILAHLRPAARPGAHKIPHGGNVGHA